VGETLHRNRLTTPLWRPATDQPFTPISWERAFSLLVDRIQATLASRGPQALAIYGSGPFSLTGQPSAMGGREAGGLAQLLPGYRSVADAEHRAAVLPHDGSHLVCRPPRDICGVHPQKQEGLHWVGLAVPMGRLDAAEMAGLAALARRYGSGELRFSESQNVLIADVPASGLEALLAEPLLQRLPVHPGPLLAEAVSCTGNRYSSVALIPPKPPPGRWWRSWRRGWSCPIRCAPTGPAAPTPAASPIGGRSG
jgi:hypothetical protein